MKSEKNENFIPALESSRGLAALCVCGLHSLMFWSHFRAAPVNNALMQFFVGTGNSAVTFFFVLSGFVLTLSLDRMRSEGRSIIPIRFVLSRIFRIYPAVIFVVLTFALIERDWILHGLDNRPWTNTLLDALLIQSTMDWPTWSARVEIAATPLILVAWYIRGRFGPRPLIVLAAVMAAISFKKTLYGDDQIGETLFVFIVGMLLADSGAIFRRLHPMIAITLMIVACVIDVRARVVVGWREQWTIVIEAVCCFVMVGLIGYRAVPTRWLEVAALRFLGRISYSFYLVHFLIVFVLLRHLPDRLVAVMSFGSPTFACLEVFSCVIVISIPVAWFLMRAVEWPGIALGKLAIASSIAAGRAAWPRYEAEPQRQPPAA
jgi:peptidoglycan/LPS O-acetylase OafA/YrhL